MVSILGDPQAHLRCSPARLCVCLRQRRGSIGLGIAIGGVRRF